MLNALSINFQNISFVGNNDNFIIWRFGYLECPLLFDLQLGMKRILVDDWTFFFAQLKYIFFLARKVFTV